jgi:HlyD family secretion protein
MEAVIDAFLILAREAEVEPLSEEFDVREVVAHEVARVQPLLVGRPIELAVIDEGTPKLFAPPHVLAVMIGNLLGNAVRFTDSGRIELHLAPERIEVRDTGIGMTPEALMKAFDPFYRADHAREEGPRHGVVDRAPPRRSLRLAGESGKPAGQGHHGDHPLCLICSFALHSDARGGTCQRHALSRVISNDFLFSSPMSAARTPSPARKASAWPRRMVVAAAALAILAAGAYAWRHRSSEEAASAYRTVNVDRGDIRVTISATGALNATSKVDVGSQISGQVTDVPGRLQRSRDEGAGDRAHRPEHLRSADRTGTAQINSARADLATAQATVRNAEADYNRKAELAQQQLIARGDLDLARAARDQARAQVASAQAQIRQQTASTQSTRLNLQRTVIRAPVDGVVLSRSVEPGQTVAASLQAPVLFQIAEDLSQMEILLAVDEADIGQVKPGLEVGFTVDAFPERRFRGKVKQVRLAATNTANVITYPVVVTVGNSDQSLLPGMTANAEIEVSHRDNVLRVSNAALRYKPDDDGTSVAAQQGGTRGNFAQDFERIGHALTLNAGQQAAFDEAMAAIRQRAAARIAAPAAQNSGATLVRSWTGRRRWQQPRRQRWRQRRRDAPTHGRAFQSGSSPRSRPPSTKARRRYGTGRPPRCSVSRRAPLYKLAGGRPQAVTVRVGRLRWQLHRGVRRHP